MAPTRAAVVGFVLAALACTPPARRSVPPPAPNPLPARVQGAHLRPVGDPRRGYGSREAQATLERLRRLGVNTVGVLLEGRLDDADDRSVRGPDRAALDAARRTLEDARRLGLATLLVPHLYVNDGTWRGRLDHLEHDDWWSHYGTFVETAAAMASSAGATVLCIGLEFKAMSGDRAIRPRIQSLTTRIRKSFTGQLVYAANWDEAEEVVFWDLVDLAGVNGYYPLVPTPSRGAEKVGRRLTRLARTAERPVLVVEVGYRSSPLSHLKPWEWPEQIEPRVDLTAQADAWAAVLTHWLDAPGIRGLMVWVVPTDPDAPDSEPLHGFNPLNKPAEHVIRRAFTR